MLDVVVVVGERGAYLDVFFYLDSAHFRGWVVSRFIEVAIRRKIYK